jgi:hypothetical protein
MTFQMCKYVALCEEGGLSPESQPAVRSHPKPSNPFVFNTPSNYVSKPRTPVDNVNLQGVGATAATTKNVSPQALLNSTFQGAGTATPVHVPAPTTPVNNVNLLGVGAGAGAGYNTS